MSRAICIDVGLLTWRVWQIAKPNAKYGGWGWPFLKVGHPFEFALETPKLSLSRGYARIRIT